MKKLPAHYAALGVPPAAPAELIHAAYITLAKACAPRRAGDAEDRFKALGLAWGTLKNSELRARYDQELALLGLNCVACVGRGVTYRSLGFTRREELRCEVCRGTGRNDLEGGEGTR